jgi:putative ABC transport system ATP-binding protein/lipoprotein-releasing system ATP-binding protein
MKTQLALEVRDLYRFYHTGEEETLALRGVSLEVKSGELAAIMGPSGSGKSTLLHIIAGLTDKTSGSIDWPALGPRETLRPWKIGFVAQEQSLMTSLNVRENIELPMLFMGSGQKEAEARAEDILERLNLSEIADKLPDELSGGQMKRAASARALASRPKLILADEPTGQLDHATARQFLDVLFAWITDTDIAVVMTTHDREVAGCMKTIWTMEHGVMKEGVK